MSSEGSPGGVALRLLARRKLGGFARRQLRRLRTPKGALLAMLGVGFFVLWFGGFVSLAAGSRNTRPESFEIAVSGGLLMLTILTAANAFSFRGLYLPQAEIETLFAAPVSRAELIRYRLASSLARSLFGAILFGWILARRAPSPICAFAGAVLAMTTLQLFAQALSLLAGDAENRLTARLAKLPLRWLALLFAVAMAWAIFQIVPSFSPDPRSSAPLTEMLAAIREHPVVSALMLPFRPWVRAITAPGLAQGWPHLLACLLVLAVAWRVVPRIRVDYRELSLETSADVARRIARARRGLSIGGGPASGRLRSLRPPRFAGTGPFGAVAWRKSVSIVRKAQTSLLLRALIVVGFCVLSVALFRGRREESAIASAAFVGAAGTVYLCLGLRFDFREDLDLLGSMRSWPIAPWKLFLATLLPEVLLISCLIALGIAGVSLYHGEFDPRALAILAGVLPVVLAWAAIDNASFLVAPFRVGAGHDGALLNAGRMMILMLVRMLVLALVFAIAAAPLAVLQLVPATRGTLGIAIGTPLGLAVLAAEIAVLIGLGGQALRRFDVARDRP